MKIWTWRESDMKKLLIVSVIVLTNVFLASAAYSQGTLRLGFLTKPQTLNPVIGLTKTSGYISDMLFNSLYGIRKVGDDEYDLVPELAKGPPVPMENNAYQVVLRDDVLWHNGDKLNSKDIICTYKSIKKNRNYSAVASRIRKISRMEYIDAQRLRVVFSTYVGPTEAMDTLNFKIIPLVSLYHQQIQQGNVVQVLNSIDYRMTNADRFSTYPCGTGPFMMRQGKHYNPEGARPLVLVANPNYFLGAPEFEQIQIRFYSNATAMRGDVAAGNRHFIINPPPELLATLRAASDAYEMFPGKYNETIFIGYNWARFGARNDFRVGIYDFATTLTDAWMQGIHADAQYQVGGIVTRIYGPVTYNHCETYGIENLEIQMPEHQNIRKQSKPMRLSILYKSFDREHGELGTYFTDAMSNEAGIDVDLKPEGVNDYYNNIRGARDYDFIVYRIRPSNNLARYFEDGWRTGSPFNISNYSSGMADKLIGGLEELPRDSQESRVICKDIYDRIVRDFPGSWLWSYMDIAFVNTRLRTHASGVNFFRPFEGIQNWRERH
jgi:ABC-type oligopeptide transport system substrate-binding subunit